MAQALLYIVIFFCMIIALCLGVWIIYYWGKLGRKRVIMALLQRGLDEESEDDPSDAHNDQAPIENKEGFQVLQDQRQNFKYRRNRGSSRIATARTIAEITTGDWSDVVDQIKTVKAGIQNKDLISRLTRAGLTSEHAQRIFLIVQIVSALAVPLMVFLFIYQSSPSRLVLIAGMLLGLVFGYAAPNVWLARKEKERVEDIERLLPLLIEEISIGTSAGLAISSSIRELVSLSEARDSVNATTELFSQVMILTKHGLSLEEALREVARRSGVLEASHALNYLAQCSQYGGEISRQLIELADAMMMNRVVRISEVIGKLPVVATFPLFVVTAGFLLILYAMIGTPVMEVLSGMQ